MEGSMLVDCKKCRGSGKETTRRVKPDLQSSLSRPNLISPPAWAMEEVETQCGNCGGSGKENARNTRTTDGGSDL